MPQNDDVPTFSAPAVPAFSMPYPDFSAFNVGFWWQLTNAIVTGLRRSVSYYSLPYCWYWCMVIVTRFGGGE